MARPWYSFYPADYARDTGHLSMLEHGAYRLLMDHYYSTGEPLSTDVERLLRLCRASVEAEQAAVRFVLAEFFVLGDDGYHHVRIDAELVKAAEKLAKCATAGKVSAAKRQQTFERKGSGRSTDVGTDVVTDGAAEGQPSQSQSQSQKKKDRALALSRFADFWSACPKKIGKGKAEGLFIKACERTSPDALIEAMRRYAKTQVGQDETYTAHPSTWLNQRRWEDEDGGAVVIRPSAFNSPEEQENQRKALERMNAAQAQN